MTESVHAEKVVFQIEELDAFTDTDLLGAIVRERLGFCVLYKIGSVGVTNDPTDIADDFLDLIYFCECLSPSCSEMGVERVPVERGLTLKLIMTVSDCDGFFCSLRRIVPFFLGRTEECRSVYDDWLDFGAKLFEKALRLPHLGDCYVANFLSGSRYLDDKRFWQETHPLWRYGIWKSFASYKFDFDFYVTSSLDGVWVVPGDQSLVQRLLTDYGGFSSEGAQLVNAASVRLNEHPHILVGPNVTVRVPTALIGKARKSWRKVIAPSLAKKFTRMDWTSKDPQEDIGDFFRRVNGNWEHCYKFKWSMTINGDAVVCGYENVSFVAFLDGADHVKPEQLRELNAAVEELTDLVRDQAGMTTVAPLDWSVLSPEKFEDLCYEVLLRCGRFEESTFRKHGNTRSRDGGRDIETKTIGRFDRPSEKWLYQCKFTLAGKSLSGSKVSVSDVVDQYAASGFGVMTNETIDSTLYDKIDAIGKNRSIGTDVWDGRRIHRFIASRRDLMDRFFSESGDHSTQ